MRFILTAGQAHDVTTVPELLDGMEADGIIADRAYDTNAVRSLIAERGAQAVIPSTRSRTVPIPHNALAYKLRNRIERFFNKLKHLALTHQTQESTFSLFSERGFRDEALRRHVRSSRDLDRRLILGVETRGSVLPVG